MFLSYRTPPWRSDEPVPESPATASRTIPLQHHEEFVSSTFSRLLIAARIAARFLCFQRLVLVYILVVRAVVFQQVFVAERPNTRRRRPRLRQHLWILNRYLNDEIIHGRA